MATTSWPPKVDRIMNNEEPKQHGTSTRFEMAADYDSGYIGVKCYRCGRHVTGMCLDFQGRLIDLLAAHKCRK